MIAYLDCTNGVAGDMLVASLLDAGAPWDEFQRLLAGLKVHGYNLQLSDVTRAGLRARHFQVELLEKHHHHHRDLNTILAIIRETQLPPRVKDRATAVFTKLAQAEAFVHHCDVSAVHFHEVGAVDAIVDIVGACVCLELLGIDTLYFSKVAVGSGQVKGSHGVLPVPAPATARLLMGQAIFPGAETGELATPTGAAILTALGSQRVEGPEMTLAAIGYGAGTRDDAGRPNVVRVLLGSEDRRGLETDHIGVIRCNLDDITGEHLGWLAEELLRQGALDVTYTPVYMKKGRPATTLEVLAPPDKMDALVEKILTHSTSFGVRIGHETRFKLGREFVTVILPEGKVRVKLGYYKGRVAQISPEFEDCRKIVERTGVNFRTLYARAAEAARAELPAENAATGPDETSV